MNKNIILSIVTLIVVVVILIFGIVSISNSGANVAASGDGVEDTIAVYGQGKVFIQPDIAYIVFGVETRNKDPKIAQDENEQLMNELIKALESANISRESIRTVDYDVYKNYNYSYYNVSTLIEVSIEEVERASEIINIVSDAGSNVFRRIRFDLIDRQSAYNEALDMALERAAEKAASMAESTGRKVASVISIEEDSSTKSFWESDLTNYVSSSSAYTDSGNGSISSGQLQISAIVNVVYRLK